MKGFIEWLEKDVARTRKVVLLSTIFIYLAVTVSLFTIVMLGYLKLDSNIITLYTIFTGLAGTLYAFFTGTSSKKTSDLADKATELLIEKLNEKK